MKILKLTSYNGTRQYIADAMMVDEHPLIAKEGGK